MFKIKNTAILANELHNLLDSKSAGAFVSFEGRVRNNNEGKSVNSLEYQVYHELAVKEGEKILEEAKAKFNIIDCSAIHREGHLNLGDIAILIGTISKHRKESYLANKYIIDQIKLRLPIWKKEHYQTEEHRWVFCKDHLHHQHFNEEDYYQKQEKIVRQEKLKSSSVLVIGAGGLGSSLLTSLTQAGIGTLGIVDFDQIDISNLHRQFLFNSNQVGEQKSLIAQMKLKELNPFIHINHHHDVKIDYSNAEMIFKEYDFIVDASDNLQTKYVIHDVCFKLQKPFILGSIFKKSAIIRTFDPTQSYGCHRCFTSKEQKDHFLGNCNDFGVLGATVNLVGSLMASEVINYLEKNINHSLKQTILIDSENLEITKVFNKKNLNCHFCQHIENFQIETQHFGLKNSDLLLTDQLIPIENLDIDEIKSKISPDHRAILKCPKGITSKSLTYELRSQGLKNIFYLEHQSCCH